MDMANKEIKKVGVDFLVKSGSEYANQCGDCIDQHIDRDFGLMLKLSIPDGDIWFKESELKELM